MRYNLKLFLRIFYKSFFKTRGTHAHLTRKRLGFLWLFYLVWPIWGAVVWFSFFLDDLLFPSYKDRAVDNPLFILGNFRSGSTFLQRLIAKDRKQFSSARTWDIFLSPSITLTKSFSLMLGLDRLFGSPLLKIFKKFDQRTLGKVAIHRISFFEPEEDENFLLHNWSSFFAGVMFPFIDDFLPYFYFDSQIPVEEKTAVMDFYRSIIQRFLFTKPGQPHLLSKNPSFSPKAASIFKHFPTAKIVYLVRDPMDMLPSTISWFSYTWHVFSDPLERYPFIPEICQFTKHWYEYPLEILSKIDPANYLIIKYEDLTEHPEETVRIIYDHFGYQMTESFAKSLKQAVEERRSFRNPHYYSLDEMGISREQVFEEYKDIYDRFKFNRSVKKPPSD